MPIVVPCPGCPAKLSAPESAAGKKIRCPKCGAVAPVPALIAAEEVPVVEAKVSAPAKPRVKPVVADDDEDDPPRKKAKPRDDEDDDRPRRKRRPAAYDEDDDPPPRRRPRKAGGGGGGMVVALVVIGGLLLLGGVGAGIYFLTGKGGVFAKKAPVPPGWKQYDYPQSGFRAHFPSEPQAVMTINGPGGLGGVGARPGRFGGGGFGGGGFGGVDDWSDVESAAVYTCGDAMFGAPAGGVTVTVTVAWYRNGVPRAARDQLSRGGNAKFGDMETRRVRWLGGDAAEVIMGGSRLRVAYTDRAMVAVQIHGPNGQRAKPEEEEGFFDNFELTR